MQFDSFLMIDFALFGAHMPPAAFVSSFFHSFYSTNETLVGMGSFEKNKLNSKFNLTQAQPFTGVYG